MNTDSSNRVSILVATDSHVERIARAFGCNIVQVRRPVNRSRQIYPHLVIGLPRLETRRNLTHIRHTCLYTFIFFTLQFSRMSNVSRYYLVLSILLALRFYFQLALKRTYNDDHTRHGWETTVPWTVEHRFLIHLRSKTSLVVAKNIFFARFVEFSFVRWKMFARTRAHTLF